MFTDACLAVVDTCERDIRTVFHFLQNCIMLWVTLPMSTTTIYVLMEKFYIFNLIKTSFLRLYSVCANHNNRGLTGFGAG